MKRDKIIFLLIIAAMGFIIFYSLKGDEETREQYIARIAEMRVEKDLFFRNHEDSPFKENSLPFKGLNYFPPNPDFIVNARIVPIEQKEIITLATSDNKEKKYEKFGYAEFDLLGKTNRVLLFQMEEPYADKLFLPFADETSTEETYGAGRYLELDKPTGNSITIDFNLAYNPYCAYTEGYSCPFPPRENILEVPIKAGEKKYE